MKAVVAAFNQEKALVGAFSVIIKPVVEPMDRFTALIPTHPLAAGLGAGMRQRRRGLLGAPLLLVELNIFLLKNRA